MPGILLLDDDPGHGYNSFAHIEAIMHYPEGGAERDAFRRAVFRELLLPVLQYDVTEFGSIELRRDEFEAIAYGNDMTSLTSSLPFQTRRRNGFLAASCLRFMMSAAEHRRTSEPEEDFCKVVAWGRYLTKHLYKKREEEFRKEEEDRHLSKFLKEKPSKNYKKLLHTRRDYVGVAHFWAAAYEIDGSPAQADQDGTPVRRREDGGWLRLDQSGRWVRADKTEITPTDLFSPTMLIPFLSRAEAIRKAAQRLDVYRCVYKEFEESQLYTVATEVEHLPDPETGISAGTEAVLVLPEQTYTPDPLSKDIRELIR